jgi:hypothetical protein
MPDGVCMVLLGLIEEPLELVHRWPHLMLVAVHSGRDMPHAGATYLPIIAIIVVSRCGGPLKALLVPLLGALLGIIDGDVGRRLHAVAWGRIPASLGRPKFGCLIAGGVLGADAT